MTDKRLLVFSTLADCLSFARTAALMGISQPAVSKNIAALEAEIGAALFVRYGRSVVLTDKGKALLLLARKVLEAYTEIENIKE